jgi:hypothetical protein
MRARIESQCLYLHQADVPHYQKSGSVVRNSLFWAMSSIALSARRARDWEFDDAVWVALERMLTAFTVSGYLGLSETQLIFLPEVEIPPPLKPVATWEDFSWMDEESHIDPAATARAELRAARKAERKAEQDQRKQQRQALPSRSDEALGQNRSSLRTGKKRFGRN